MAVTVSPMGRYGPATAQVGGIGSAGMRSILADAATLLVDVGYARSRGTSRHRRDSRSPRLAIKKESMELIRPLMK